jgi:TolB-like protein/DNA-binding winged helix-turn-helix (wHTH) protein
VGNDFRVGPWQVQPGLNAVSHDGASLRLEPKVMEVLLCLAHRPGELVSKEELLRTVWPDTFVSDDVLIRSISELRRVFEDDAKEPRFIQTIHKRGYRLIAPVARPHSDTAVPTRSPASTESSTPPRWILPLGVALGLVCLALLAALRTSELRRWLTSKNDMPPIHSLAVLPLQNLSGDSGQEYFADAMTEELITELSRISALNVISRTSVMPYKDSKKSLPEIARELHADAIVEGSIVRSGDRVRVTAQLIYAAKDTNVWAQTYDRDLQDVLTLQSAVARSIADEIRVQVKPQESAHLATPHRVNRKALDLYLAGRGHITKASSIEFYRGKEKEFDREIRAGVASFQQATQEDPNYLPAYLGIFDAVGNPTLVPHLDLIPTAKQAVRRALELDDSLVEAHLDMAWLFMEWDYDYTSAGREYERALQLNPNSADVHDAYANYFEIFGRENDAQRERELAQSLDPKHNHFMNVFPMDWSLDKDRQSLEQGPDDPFLRAALGKSYQINGRYREAVEQYIKTTELYGDNEEAQLLRRGYSEGKYKDTIRGWMKEWDRQADHRYLPPLWPAFLYANLGDKDDAFRWLERAYQEHSWCMLYLNLDDMWDPIRSDPRFAEYVRRAGLPPDHGQFLEAREVLNVK